MLMSKKTTFLAIFLAAIAVASAFYFSSALKDALYLRDQINFKDSQIKTLQQERQDMLNVLNQAMSKKSEIARKNAILKEYLRQADKKVRKIDAEFQKALLRAEELNSQIALLKQENVDLHSSNEQLKREKALMVEENEQLKSRLASIPELKRAIRELRTKARQTVAKTRNKVTQFLGNRGYVIKDGRSTYPQKKIRIEVIPVSE